MELKLYFFNSFLIAMYGHDEEIQRLRALIMPDLEKMIEDSIKEIKEEFMMANKPNREQMQLKGEQQKNHGIQHLPRDFDDIRKELKAVGNYKQQYEGIKDQIIAVKKSIGQLQNQIKKLNQDCKGNRQVLSHKFERLMQKYDQPMSQIKRYERKQKKQEMIEENDIEIQKRNNLLNPKSANISKYEIEGRQIQLVNGDGLWYQLLGSVSVGDKKTNTFNIINTKGSDIFIGIIDAKHINDRDSLNQKDCILYHGTGNILEGGQFRQKGLKNFKNGEAVVMTVQGDKVSWTVEGQIFEHQCSTIKEKWVPVIMMYHNQDKLQWE